MNEALLDQKLGELEKVRAWSPRAVSKLEALLRAEDDAEVFRVNPLAFAAKRGVDESESIDLFLQATRVGLFRMNWAILCPQCGDPVESFRTLKMLHNHYTCGMCHIKGEADFDDYIQVSFTVNAEVRDISFNHPETLDAKTFHLTYHFSPEGRFGPGGPKFTDAIGMLGRVVDYTEPGETKSWPIDATPGYLMGWDLITNQGFMFQVQAGAAATTAALVLRDGKYTPDNGLLAAGKVVLSIQNTTAARAAVMVLQLAPDHFDHKRVMHFDPFLTGRRLLTSQTFRELYRTEVIGGSEGIGVKDTTLLFTDLKGSTEMYDRIGDLKAFSLVRQHFDRLGRVIHGQAGAVVKTIGDAVMASFNTPEGAVRAAVLMLDEIERFNKEHGDQALILKIGVHHGASIAVTLNERLDYFGQTVNIAARVQGLAGAEEIYVTEDVYDAPGVKEVLSGYAVTPEFASLKGVSEKVRVYKVTEKGARPSTGAAPVKPSRPAPKPAARRPKSAKRPAARTMKKPVKKKR